MKMFFSRYLISGLLILLLWACKKDEVKVIAKPGSAPSLAATLDTVILLKQYADDQAIAFKRGTSDFGYNAVVKYELQFARKGTNFADKAVVPADSITTAITVRMLNTIANQLELEYGVYADIEVRISATISDNYPPTYSNAKALVVSSYQDLVEYPSMYVAGDFQAWTPATGPKLASFKSDKNYEGYVWFPSGSTLFKITSLPSWDGTNYGGTSTNNGGVLSGTGDNLKVTGAGYYFITVNLDDKSWQATRTTWSMIGDAVGSWDTDVDLTFDEAKGTWTGTVQMNAGAFKFRANHSYDINYGDNKPSDPILNKGGDNIKVAAAGTYEVTLSLSIAGNYTYLVKKK
ncbi:SusF/SusE family outer membrane protein [Chitinophaga silvatica]|uniref:SusF/SusE family outer membrane protein n=1 Tax=Chitinophaga silvatica TaxID=2282649 RepID=A0A3E1Y7Q3_9BACT|nr:SusE domain-containing protein [Chitinophaga silvatica]RFS21053.1 SusF/SusE family outer membrane protein [Chitinophaga silvatica]